MTYYCDLRFIIYVCVVTLSASTLGKVEINMPDEGEANH